MKLVQTTRNFYQMLLDHQSKYQGKPISGSCYKFAGLMNKSTTTFYNVIKELRLHELIEYTKTTKADKSVIYTIHLTDRRLGGTLENEFEAIGLSDSNNDLANAFVDAFLNKYSQLESDNLRLKALSEDLHRREKTLNHELDTLRGEVEELRRVERSRNSDQARSKMRGFIDRIK